MSAPPAVLNKVKLLLRLATSPNANEADNARVKAEELISKHNITEADLLSDDKIYYGEDEKLFTTIGVTGWKQHLSLAIANYFDCQIVQESLGAANSEVCQFSYFVYGDPDQVKDTQFVYHAFEKKIDFLVLTRCLGRGEVFIDSYCEGVTESIRWNIQMYGIDIPEVKRSLKKEEPAFTMSSKSMTHSGTKEEPTDNRIDVHSNSLIRDIRAYFQGIDDGKNLSLQDILELEVENEVCPACGSNDIIWDVVALEEDLKEAKQ